LADAVTVFVIGLGGVFAGMALLYLSIRITSGVVARLESKGRRDE
jgi:Na+-transporting methylmalonyl-CoA/oxaloacetate decarboxylase gamma subunit